MEKTPSTCAPQPAASGAAEIGPHTAAVIDELLAENALFRLRPAEDVLGLADEHEPVRLEAACATATAAGDPLYRTIKGISPQAPQPALRPLRPATPAHPRTCTDLHSCSPTHSPTYSSLRSPT